MSTKTEQINLRISSKLKEQLAKMSEAQGLSMSDFIRQTLETAIEKGDKIEDRITSIEERLDYVGEKRIRLMLHAGATIANLDTNRPIDQCITTTLRVFGKSNLGIDNLLQLSRSALEQKYIGIQDHIKNELGLSNPAIAFISLLFSAFAGFTYNETIFDISPMSVKTLERIREVLESK